MEVHFLVAALRREPSASGARVADADSPNDLVRAAAAYRLRQGWRDFLLCSGVFLRGLARVRLEGVNEVQPAERNERKRAVTLAWDRQCFAV
jgi:hypothetical protein